MNPPVSPEAPPSGAPGHVHPHRHKRHRKRLPFWLRWPLGLIATVSAIITLVAQTAPWFPGELCCHWTLHAGLGLLIGAILWKRHHAWRGRACMLLMLLALLPWVRAAYDTRTSAPTREALSILWSNVDRLNEHRSEALATIAASDADLIGLTEVFPDDRHIFSHERWPYQFWTDRTWAKNCALLSKKPFVLSKQRLWTRIETIDAVLDVNDRPLRVLIVHLDTPMEPEWATLRDREFHDLVTALNDFTLPGTNTADVPVLVMGDMNATPATHLWQPLLTTTGLTRAPGPTPPTYPGWSSPWPWIPGIPIDHILVRHGKLTPLEAVIIPGSDHRALRTTWGPE